MREQVSKAPGIESDFIQMRQFLDGVDLSTDLITEFFFVFSRFEYALKRAGYVRSNHQGYAEANWAGFARSVRRLYERDRDQNPTFSAAVDYLLDNPPKCQVVGTNRSLEWADLDRRQGQTEIGWLLVIVRAVRNNLFHGGKYPSPSGHVREPARNPNLLNYSLVVLQTCLCWESNVRNKYMTALYE